MRLNPGKLISEKYLELAKLGAQAGITQLFMQGIGALTSILIIRVLAPEHFALYTMALTFLGMMSVLSDGGIGSGVMSQGGKVWQDRTKLGSVLQTGMKLRKQFSIAAILIVIPIFAAMMRHHGTSWGNILCIELALLPLFYVQLSEGLLGMVPALHQKVGAVQSIKVRMFVMRIALVGIVLATLPYTALVILSTGIATAWSNWRMRKLTGSLCDIESPEDPEVRREILTIVKRSLPNATFFCISGSLSIWLISLFGETTSIAEVGALGSISRIVLSVSMMIRMVLIPRYSRLPEERGILTRRFFQVQGLAWMIGITIFCVVLAMPELILWLLGSNYSGLVFELKLQAAFIGINFVTQSVNWLASARGYILKPIPLIVSQITGQIIGICIFDYTTVAGVILISIIPTALQLILLNLHVYKEIKRRCPA